MHFLTLPLSNLLMQQHIYKLQVLPNLTHTPDSILHSAYYSRFSKWHACSNAFLGSVWSHNDFMGKKEITEENRPIEKEQDTSFMLPFTLAFWSLWVIRMPGEKDDNLGLACIHMPAAAMNIIGLYGLRRGC